MKGDKDKHIRVNKFYIYILVIYFFFKRAKWASPTRTRLDHGFIRAKRPGSYSGLHFLNPALQIFGLAHSSPSGQTPIPNSSKGAILEALYRIFKGFWFNLAELIMTALLHFEEKVHRKGLTRAETIPLLMPRLLCHVLEHLGFPEEPRIECW